jgi:hypothetical protein
MFEAKMFEMGFKKLQEKEKLVFFEKTMNDEQMFLIYDKENKRVKSLDSYTVENGQMKLLKEKVKYRKKIENILNRVI